MLFFECFFRQYEKWITFNCKDTSKVERYFKTGGNTIFFCKSNHLLGDDYQHQIKYDIHRMHCIRGPHTSGRLPAPAWGMEQACRSSSNGAEISRSCFPLTEGLFYFTFTLPLRDKTRHLLDFGPRFGGLEWRNLKKIPSQSGSEFQTATYKLVLLTATSGGGNILKYISHKIIHFLLYSILFFLVILLKFRQWNWPTTTSHLTSDTEKALCGHPAIYSELPKVALTSGLVLLLRKKIQVECF